jgi:hypothetical protein
MCNLYSITTNQAPIICALSGHEPLRQQPPADAGIFPDYPAPIRNADADCRRPRFNPNGLQERPPIAAFRISVAPPTGDPLESVVCQSPSCSSH